MECACSVDIDTYDGEYAEISECNERVAKTVHKCSECGRKINIGEIYENYRAKYEEGFFTNKTCSDCLSIRNTFFTNGYYYGAIIEYFYEFINENHGEISEKCLSSLTPRARELACEHIQEIWTEQWLDYPTQPAFRLERMIERLKLRNSWMTEREVEIERMDDAVWDAINKAKNRATIT